MCTCLGGRTFAPDSRREMAPPANFGPRYARAFRKQPWRIIWRREYTKNVCDVIRRHAIIFANARFARLISCWCTRLIMMPSGLQRAKFLINFLIFAKFSPACTCRISIPKT